MFLISISVALCHLERQIEIDGRYIDQLARHDNPAPKVPIVVVRLFLRYTKKPRTMDEASRSRSRTPSAQPRREY